MSKTKVWKLQIKKVTEIKEGQVWQMGELTPFVINSVKSNGVVTNRVGFLEHEYFNESIEQGSLQLIGALGIDYEIVDGRLVKKEIKHPAVGWVYNHSESYANYMLIYRNLENQTIKVAYENGLVEGAWISSREEDKPIGSPAVYELKFVEG